MSCGCICSNKIFSTTRKTHGGQLLSRGFSAHCVYYRVKGGAAVTDSEIARLMKAGDERGAEELLRRFGALIRYVAAPILPDERDREDCLSEVLMRAWEGIGNYDEARGSLRAWLTAIARNTALNRLRASKPADPEDGPENTRPGPEEELIRREELSELRRAISALKPAERQLVYRKYYYMQPISQIAAETGLSLRAVEGRLYRIRKQLGRALGGERNG